MRHVDYFWDLRLGVGLVSERLQESTELRLTAHLMAVLFVIVSWPGLIQFVLSYLRIKDIQGTC